MNSVDSLHGSDCIDDHQGDVLPVEPTTCESTPLIEEDRVKVYKKRWFMLFIFGLNTAMNGCLFTSITPINNIVSKYYNVGSVDIEWLSNMCVLSYVILAIPTTWCMNR